ncbi:RDD family protein [Actinomycetospora chibensis]|uniref:RDD family protein n=1 Tax=Actinomycetospora chibensis TaxID=663606 RepID=A0ABV9RDS9_9PSEU|nr:RDD family protein [Actinomycetospora chibensis]MDD7925678.1 RDD family protein [Actinomycetospora chibensis]
MALVDRVVIGEAVELDVRTARLPSRALGLALDVLIMLVLLLVVLLVMSAVGADVDPALAAAVSLITTVGVFVGYPLLWETLTRGRSPGKYAMGLRVVRTDGGPIVFRHALARALAGFIVDFGLLSLFTGLIGIVVSASTAQGQRVGDLLAGTVVVRERLPRTGLESLPPPDPGLAAWARGCELSRLPDDLALAARQFLVRAPQLAGAVRASLAERLAADVSARVAPPPPPGVPAEPYLLAVLGERRRRETDRLTAGAGAAPPGSGPPGSGPPGWAPAVPAGAPVGMAPGPGAPAPSPYARPGAPFAPAAEAPPATRAEESTPSPGGFAPPG